MTSSQSSWGWQPPPSLLIHVRRCDWCGAELDPIDWCGACQASAPEPCRQPHRRLRKRADARYCDNECRDMARRAY